MWKPVLIVLLCCLLSPTICLPRPKDIDEGTEEQRVAELDAKLDEGKLFSSNRGRRCWGNRNEELTPRWYEHGEQVDIGTFFYKCRDSKLVLSGCIVENSNSTTRLPLNETYVSGKNVIQCSRWGDALMLRSVGCVPESQGGKSYLIGESWLDTESRTWWLCALEGIAAKARLGGCVESEGSNRLHIGESIDVEHTTFECQIKGANSVAMVPVGCVLNGSHYRVGQQWQDGDFLFYCRRTTEGSCEKSCIGCMHNGHRLYDGDRVRKERAVLQCEVREKRHSMNAVACVSNAVVERAINCVWNEAAPDGTYRVKRKCVLRDNHADIETLGCLFEKDGLHRLTLKPDTFTLWRDSLEEPGLGIACRNTVIDGESWPQLETFPIEETANRTAGLTSTEPRL